MAQPRLRVAELAQQGKRDIGLAVTVRAPYRVERDAPDMGVLVIEQVRHQALDHARLFQLFSQLARQGDFLDCADPALPGHPVQLEHEHAVTKLHNTP